MQKPIALFVFFLATSTVSAQTAVTLDTTIELGSVSGADRFQVQLQTDLGVLVATSDPATSDPNGDKIVDVPLAGNGTGSIGLDVWLTGKGPGNYLVFARSVDANNIAGPWSAGEAITYGGPPAPPVTFGAMAFAALVGAYVLRRKRQV